MDPAVVFVIVVLVLFVICLSCCRCSITVGTPVEENEV